MPKPPSYRGKVKSGGQKPNLSAPSTCDAAVDPLENFEIELLWCIQQLEDTLNFKKVNQRLVEDSLKALNTLKSHKAPLIKKRQVMRSVFGDYRAKMAEEEKKLYKASSKVNFAAPPSTKKSKFLKKSSVLSSGPNSSEPASTSHDESTEIPSHAGGSDEGMSEEKAKEEEVVPPSSNAKSFSFKPSDNSFRFNFMSTDGDDDAKV